jgi:ATP-dependent RNA helicase RhlE
MTTFADLGLAEPLLRAVTAKGYDTPSPIQEQAIPKVLAGHDIMGLAQTGTGKTAAFALPVLHRFLTEPRRPEPGSTRALVLAPTRELAAQIAAGFMSYGTSMRLRVAVVFGGVPIGKQIRQIAGGVDVIVATPGRLLDLCQQRAVRLDRVEVLILDEADHMFDLGFILPIKKIVRMLPQQRQTLMFSATMPKEIKGLAEEVLTNPIEVVVSPVSSTSERVQQQAIPVGSHGEKPEALREFLTTARVSRAIIFTRTKHGADKVVEQLERAGFMANAIHGNKKQSHRERTLALFRSGQAPLLVATDIAARGIDVADISHVINYDMPEVAETYVHRIGRTARAGASGEAVSFVAPDEISLIRAAERLMKVSIPGSPTGQGAARPPRGRQGQRPQQSRPFAPRGGYAARSEGGRSDGPRSEGHRSEGNRGYAPRQEAYADSRPARPRRDEGEVWSNYEAPRNRYEGGRSEGGRFENSRSEPGRDNRRPDRPQGAGRPYSAGRSGPRQSSW